MNLSHWYKKHQQTFLRASLLNTISQLTCLKKITHVIQLGAVKLNDTVLVQYGLLKPVIISPDKYSIANIVTLEEQLPLQTKSVECLIVLHAFENCGDAHELIREIHRVVKDDGFVVVVGFNKKTPYTRCFPFPTECKRIVPMHKADEWFSVLGFTKKEQQFLFRNKSLDKLFNKRLKNINKQWLHLGTLYLCVYQKQVIPLTFDASMWQQKNTLATPSLVETRNYE